jgi:hypothetical protein
MIKSIRIKLRDFPSIPVSLIDDLGLGNPKEEIEVNLANLYHHFYLDKFGTQPPNPDPSRFEYVRHLTSDKDFRTQKNGIGSSPAHKRTSSFELGQAFCRLFLHDYLDFYHFDNLGDFIDRYVDQRFGRVKLRRKGSGDTPDFICANRENKIYLAEAKGRYGAISFGSAEFKKWREQFSRVEFVSQFSPSTPEVLLSVKGVIIATHFGTASGSVSDYSTIFAEDPRTPGQDDISIDGVSMVNISQAVLRRHYSNIFVKLGYPLFSSALENGFTLTDQLSYNVFVYEFVFEKFKGVQFVGGFFLREGEKTLNFSVGEKGFEYTIDNPFAVNKPFLTFFGLELTRFKSILNIIRGNNFVDAQKVVVDLPFIDSSISYLKDGSLLAPLDLLKVVGQIRI